MSSDKADIRLRFFTPGHEMNLGGHGTIATIYTLKSSGLLGNQTDITMETKVGILPIKIAETAENHYSITMQ